MKTAFRIILISVLSFNVLGQLNHQEGCRFSSIDDFENKKGKLFSVKDSADLMLKIYDAVLHNRIDLSIDTSYLGNPLEWIKVPQTQHFYSPESGEIIYTIEKIDFLTYTYQPDQPLSDAGGNPVIRVNDDGFEEYVYPPREESPLSAAAYFEFRVLEKGKYNPKKEQWEYTIDKIGIEQFTQRKNIVWVDFKALKKVIKNWKDYPLLLSLESGDISLSPYKQIGTNHDVNNDENLFKRTVIKNIPENEILFKESNCAENSDNFLDIVFSNADTYSYEKKIRTKMCADNQSWDYPYISDKFKEFVPLTFPRDEVNCPILIYSQADSMFNNAYHESRVRDRGEMGSFDYYVVHLYIKPSEIKELRIEEVKVKYPDGTWTEFKVKSIAFVIDYEGVNREIFMVNLADMAAEHQDKDWFKWIVDRKFTGEQYWQSDQLRRKRY